MALVLEGSRPTDHHVCPSAREVTLAISLSLTGSPVELNQPQGPKICFLGDRLFGRGDEYIGEARTSLGEIEMIF
jgi:hypothetical protein